LILVYNTGESTYVERNKLCKVITKENVGRNKPCKVITKKNVGKINT